MQDLNGILALLDRIRLLQVQSQLDQLERDLATAGEAVDGSQDSENGQPPSTQEEGWEYY